MATTPDPLDPDRVLHALGQSVIVTDPAGAVVVWNAAAERLYGWTAEQALGRPIHELTVPEVSQQDAEQIMQALRSGTPWSGSFTVRRRDGTSFRALVTNAGVYDRDGELVAISGLSTPLGEVVRPLFEHSIDAALVVGVDGRVRYASPAIATVLGLAPEAVEGRSALSLLHPDDQPRLEQALSSGPDGSVLLELRLLASDGSWRWTEAVVTDMRADHSVHGTVLNLRDITERRAAHERLVHLALHDPLTGLPNRTLVVERITYALSRRGGAGALLFLDLDGFKAVNDRLGHTVGDEVLRSVAARLLGALRPEDTCGRLGGDEFIVLAESVNGPDQARDLAERLQGALRLPLRAGGTWMRQSASVGITLLAGRRRATELLREADTAMYRAKERGPGRYALYDGAADGQPGPGERLRQALVGGELCVHYQPVVALGSRRVTGVEALLRWDHPSRGLVLAEELIEVAEASDLIHDVGAFVLEQACGQVGRWGRPDLTLSVNVSARQLGDEGLLDIVDRALADSGLAPAQLVLEITETGLMADLATALDVLAAVRARAVRVSVDDFGTGFAGFGYLRDLPVDELKIDRSFVAGLGLERSDTAIVSSILHLARGLGLSTTGEGVETSAQAGRLQELGCELGQGFYWSRAVRAGARPPAA